MTAFPKYCLLLILPILLFITSLSFINARGPYYMGYSDPSYVYLISSLNIANGYNVTHIDHPGTTVQVIGAFVIKIYFELSSNNPDPVKDVLSRPEDYLRVFNIVLISISCLLLYLLGIVFYYFSKNPCAAIMLQLTPFVSWEIFYGLIITAPDNLLVGVSICYLILIVYYYFRIDIEMKIPGLFVILFAIVSGFGLATKLNFLPMILIPLILIKSFRSKLLFMMLSGFSFLLFVFPIISSFDVFLKWLSNLALHSGKYGQGENTVINTSTFFGNMVLVFTENYFFLFTYMLIIITLSTVFFKKKSLMQLEIRIISKTVKILISIFCSMTLLVLLLAKHYSQYYLIPSVMLCVISILLCTVYYVMVYEKVFSSKKYILITLILAISGWSFWGVSALYSGLKDRKEEGYKLLDFVEQNYSDATVISDINSPGNACALVYSTEFAGSQIMNYRTILSETLPFKLFYNRSSSSILSLNSLNNYKDLKNNLTQNKRIVFQRASNNPPPNDLIREINEVLGVNNSSYKKVFENKYNESVYKIYPGKN